MFRLEKVSVPTCEYEFATKDEAIDELRRHICEDCLTGDRGFQFEEGEENPFEPVDVIHDGVRYECRDAKVLLATPCGLEYEMDPCPFSEAPCA